MRKFLILAVGALALIVVAVAVAQSPPTIVTSTTTVSPGPNVGIFLPSRCISSCSSCLMMSMFTTLLS